MQGTRQETALALFVRNRRPRCSVRDFYGPKTIQAKFWESHGYRSNFGIEHAMYEL